MYSVLRKAPVAVLFAYLLSLTPVNGANIAWVTEPRDPTADWDIGWTDFLTAAGHNVTRMNDMTELDQGKIDAMNASDLVIISRAVNSGGYDDGDEPAQWNGLTVPMINMAAHTVRSSRWKWLDTTSVENDNEIITAVDANHPIYGGISVADVADFVSSPNDALISTVGTADGGNGMVLATAASGNVMGVLWQPGVEYYAGSGMSGADYRLYLPFGQANVDGFASEWGAFNPTPAGELIVLNAVDYMVAIPEPSTMILFGLGILGLLGSRRRQK